jgi:hypothetical protein
VRKVARLVTWIYTSSSGTNSVCSNYWYSRTNATHCCLRSGDLLGKVCVCFRRWTPSFREVPNSDVASLNGSCTTYLPDTSRQCVDTKNSQSLSSGVRSYRVGTSSSTQNLCSKLSILHRTKWVALKLNALCCQSVPSEPIRTPFPWPWEYRALRWRPGLHQPIYLLLSEYRIWDQLLSILSCASTGWPKVREC